MATVRSVVDGVWDDTSTWSTSGLPTTADLVQINTTVTASGIAMNAGAIAGSGTLVVPLTPGIFTVTCTGDISTPRVSGGSLGSPVPSGTSFVIAFGSAGKVTASMACSGWKIYGYAPTVSGTGHDNPFVATIAASAANGASLVKVTGDVTDWSHIPSGRATVWITKYTTKSKGTAALCRRGLTSISYAASSNISTLNLATTLTESKEASGYVVFESRNIALSGTSTQHTFSAASSGTLRYCELHSGGGNNISSSPDFDMTGASFKGSNFTWGANSQGASANLSTYTDCSYGIYATRGMSLSGAVFAGCTNPTAFLSGLNISNSLFTGSTSNTNNSNVKYDNCRFIANSYGFTVNQNTTASGCTFTGNTYGVAISDALLSRCSFLGQATADLYGSMNAKLKNCTLGSSTQHTWSGLAPQANYHIKADSLNDGAVSGARKCWTLGGYVTTQPTVTHPVFGAVNQMVMVDTSNRYPTYLEDTFSLQANTHYTWTWIAMAEIDFVTTSTKCELIDKLNDPLNGGVAVTAVNYPSTPTGDDTWHTMTLSYTPTEDMEVFLRVSSQEYNADNDSLYFKTWLNQNYTMTSSNTWTLGDRTVTFASGGVATDHRTIAWAGNILSNTVSGRTLPGICWEFSPNSYALSGSPLELLGPDGRSPFQYAMEANKTLTASVWIKKTGTVEVEWVCEGGQTGGPVADVRAVATTSTTWQQLSVDVPVTADGVYEINLYVYGSASEKVYLDDFTWSTT